MGWFLYAEMEEVRFCCLPLFLVWYLPLHKGYKMRAGQDGGSALLFLWGGSLLGRSGRLIGTTRRQHGGVFVLCCCWTKIKQNRPFMTSAHRSAHTTTHTIYRYTLQYGYISDIRFYYCLHPPNLKPESRLHPPSVQTKEHSARRNMIWAFNIKTKHTWHMFVLL